MPAFLDPDRPVYTCDRESCNGCEVHGKLVCHFNRKQLSAFLLGTLPAIAAGVWITVQASLIALLGWAVCFLSFFGLIEIRVMCSHCPHYAEPETKSLKCWANYGSLKLWKYRPGPMSAAEIAVFFLGLFTITGYPAVFAVIAQRWLPLVLYLVFLWIGAYMLRRFLCTKCFNFACPLNRVNQETRELFFSCNPVVRKAYKK